MKPDAECLFDQASVGFDLWSAQGTAKLKGMLQKSVCVCACVCNKLVKQPTADKLMLFDPRARCCLRHKHRVGDKSARRRRKRVRVFLCGSKYGSYFCCHPASHSLNTAVKPPTPAPPPSPTRCTCHMASVSGLQNILFIEGESKSQLRFSRSHSRQVADSGRG